MGDGVAESLQLPVGELEGRLGDLAVRDVPDGARHEDSVLGFERAQANFDRELPAILSQSVEVQPRAHRARARVCEIPRAVARVSFAKALRHEKLDPLTQKLR